MENNNLEKCSDLNCPSKKACLRYDITSKNNDFRIENEICESFIYNDDYIIEE